MCFATYIFDGNLHQGPWDIVFLHFARPVPSEMKITKISSTVVLARPGGMRRGAGRRYEEGQRYFGGLVVWIRHAVLLYETGGGFNRYAHSAGPKIIKNRPEAQILVKNAIFDDFEIFENSSKN